MRPATQARDLAAVELLATDALAFLFCFPRALLWALLPVGFVAWVLVAPWIVRRSVSFARFLGWVVINFIAALQRGIPLMPKPWLEFVPFREIENVTHRVKPLQDLL